MTPSSKVKALEFLLSLPLAACIISVVWYGLMASYFESLPVPMEITSRTNQMEAEMGLASATDLSKITGQSAGGSGSDPAAEAQAAAVGTTHAASEVASQLSALLAPNSTRKQLGHVLAKLGMEGPGIEVGASKGGAFADVVLHTWRPGKFYLVDPGVGGDAGQLSSPALKRAEQDGRLVLVNEALEDAPAQFADGSFSFIYINPSSSFRGLKHDLEDWFPKLRAGGLFAGKDYCASRNEKSSPQLSGLLQRTPWCGTYHGGGKNGQDKAGFGKYTVRAVDMFAEEVGRAAHYTLEGRAGPDPANADGLANPSWWFVK